MKSISYCAVGNVIMSRFPLQQLATLCTVLVNPILQMYLECIFVTVSSSLCS